MGEPQGGSPSCSAASDPASHLPSPLSRYSRSRLTFWGKWGGALVKFTHFLSVVLTTAVHTCFLYSTKDHLAVQRSRGARWGKASRDSQQRRSPLDVPTPTLGFPPSSSLWRLWALQKRNDFRPQRSLSRLPKQYTQRHAQPYIRIDR